MKVHTTNYFDTFIETSDDCPVQAGEMPPVKNDTRTVATIQFDLVFNNPYQFTSDDILFRVYAERNKLRNDEFETEREQFFSKGQACFRASPLTKRYGWGVHSNKEGKIALYGRETDEYNRFAADKTLKVLKAMKSGKKS